MELVHPRIGRLASRAFLGVLRLPVAVVSWFGHQAPEFLLLGGATALVYGAWQVYHPAGWIVGGVLAVVAGWRLGRTAPTVPEVKRG